MAVKEDYLAYIMDQLQGIEGIAPKKMFGGVGIFHEDKMFGMIQSNNIFRLKVDDSNRAQYEAHGSGPLTSGKKKGSMPYYEVPSQVIEDKAELQQWAQTSIAIAHS